jgi:Rieske Fe-S protein
MTAVGVSTAHCGPAGVRPPALGDVAAGGVDALSLGSLRGVGREPLAIGRDGGGIYAMTLICSHAGCEANVVDQEVICPCHGSKFDANGNVQSGPAPTGLEHYEVSVDVSGNLTIHTGRVVDSGARLKI